MFNAMIYPIRPYGIRGMIWYQGERNSKDVPQAVNYRKQLAMLINYYRTIMARAFRRERAKDFPFQFTQLPSWNRPQKEPVEGLEAPWAVNRESMRLVSQDVPNTGMAVSIDTGDAVELHPKNKKPIGIASCLHRAGADLWQGYRGLVARVTKSKRSRAIQIVLEFDSHRQRVDGGPTRQA